MFLYATAKHLLCLNWHEHEIVKIVPKVKNFNDFLR